MIKISTDGAILTKKKHAVQGTIRIIQVDDNNQPVKNSTLPDRFNKEILLFYYIGNNNSTTYGTSDTPNIYFLATSHTTLDQF